MREFQAKTAPEVCARVILSGPIKGDFLGLIGFKVRLKVSQLTVLEISFV